MKTTRRVPSSRKMVNRTTTEILTRVVDGIPAALLVATTVVACSNEANFANSKNLTANGADATAGDIAGDAGQFDGPLRDRIDSVAGGSWEPLAFTRTFPVVEREDVSAEIIPAFGQVDEAISMSVRPESTLTLKQVVRSDELDTFTQGHDGMVRTESFSVSRAGLLDLLVVVDNSTSMEEEQANLATKLDALTSAIDDTNWQIGVVNMSSPCLRLGRLIKRTDADRVEAFRAAASVGMNNNVVEKGYPMAIRALKGECNGRFNPWIREGSTVAVLVVSDEDNCGSNNGNNSCLFDYGKNATEMTQFLRELRPPEKGKLYGIHWIPNDRSCGSALGEAWKYQEGITMTGGLAGSICDDDYSSTLQSISANVRRSVTKEFRLEALPDLRVMSLMIDGETVNEGFSVEGDRIILDPSASDGKVMLVVSYSSGGVPQFDKVRLNKTPDDGTVSVFVDGEPLAQSDWSFDPDTGELTFADRPAERAAIRVAYKEKVVWRKSFSIARPDVIPAAVNVRVNGVESGDWTFDARTGSVTFNDAPEEGATVTIGYRTRGDYTLNYPVAVTQPGKIIDVFAADAVSGDVVPVTFHGAHVSFDLEDVSPARRVIVTFDYGENETLQVWDLSSDPEPGTLTLESDPPGACTDNVEVTGRRLQFRCAPGDRARLHLQYRSVSARNSEFDLSGETGTDDSRVRLQTLSVKVDGIETEDYQFVRGRVVLGPDVVAGAQGNVEISGSGVRRN